MEGTLKQTRMTLTEAIEHSKRIHYLYCKICGNIMTDELNRVEMVNAIRGQGYCASCTMDIYGVSKTE